MIAAPLYCFCCVGYNVQDVETIQISTQRCKGKENMEYANRCIDRLLDILKEGGNNWVCNNIDGLEEMKLNKMSHTEEAIDLRL